VVTAVGESLHRLGEGGQTGGSRDTLLIRKKNTNRNSITMTCSATEAPLESGKTLTNSSQRMMGETPPLFGKTSFLQGLIDELIDQINEGTICLEMGIDTYLDAGAARPA